MLELDQWQETFSEHDGDFNVSYFKNEPSEMVFLPAGNPVYLNKSAYTA